MGFIEQLKGATSEWSTYEAVAGQRKTKTLKYFFILFTILFLITGIKSAVSLQDDLQQLAVDFQGNVPDFKLVNGEFWFSEEQPYYLEGENNTALIVDTTGATDETVLDEYIDGVYITKTQIFIKQNYQVSQIDLKDFKETTITKEGIVALFPKLNWFIPVLGVFGYLVQVAGKMISSVFLASVGAFVNNAQKGRLKFHQLWNISVYALTLPMILQTLVKLVYPQLPSFFLVYYGIGIFYVVKAVQHINTKVPPNPEELHA